VVVIKSIFEGNFALGQKMNIPQVNHTNRE